MKKIVLCVTIILMLLPLKTFAGKYALLVGIDAYPEPYTLDGCVQDVNRMQDVLVEQFGFAAANIETVLDSRATFAGIKAAFQTHLIQQAQPGDVVVFYYSGHGTQTPDYNNDEDDGIDETLCPVDALATKADTWLTDDILGSWLDQIRTDKVTVILDACFSGTATRADGPQRRKTMDFGFYPPQIKTKVTLSHKQLNHILLAASAPDQLSWMLADAKGSVFTTFLYEVLVNLAASATYDALMNEVIPQVQQYVARYYSDEDQTPQLEGNGHIPLFFGADSAAQPATSTSTPVSTPETPSEDVQYDDFDLSISTNQPEYREKDVMTVTVESARNCYLRLYLVNAKQEIAQLFPNAYQQDNFIRAGQPVQIPGTGARFLLEMTEPFGTETLKAVASTVQFDDLLDINWQGKTFLDFGKMPLSEMDTRGVAIREISEVEISQAVARYRVRAR